MMPRSYKSIVILAGVLLGWATTSVAQVDPEAITLTAEDDVQTISSWYARNDDGPVVILLHNVRGVRVRNVTVRKSRPFAVHLGNVQDFVVDGLTLGTFVD